jgi:hypothetical protein
MSGAKRFLATIDRGGPRKTPDINILFARLL